RFSPMMESVIDFANRGGKVLGVCNGFQILCESGLLPGALLPNAEQQFVCKNVYMTAETGKALKIPIAHGEGRYYAEDDVLNEMEANGQVMFRYCDDKGNIEIAGNPNGAARNIAGISNKEKNVFGMMPHPERAVSTALGNVDGRQVFKLLGLN
ncbi:MAG TPA: phosphoribosylformylglycinamidine synthase I, partial [Segetibacter sp.]